MNKRGRDGWDRRKELMAEKGKGEEKRRDMFPLPSRSTDSGYTRWPETSKPLPNYQ